MRETIEAWIAARSPIAPSRAVALVLEACALAEEQHERRDARGPLGARMAVAEDGSGVVASPREPGVEPAAAATLAEDVEAVGALLFLALAGSRPGSRPLQALAPWVDPGLARVVHACLLDDADARPPTIADVAVVLTRFSPDEDADEPAVLDASTRAARAPRATLPTSWEDARDARPGEIGGDPLVGAVLGDRFAIVEKLGAGGMGAVYAATDRTSGEAVAVKVLRAEIAAAAPLLARRFVREAVATQRVASPYAVRVIDAGEDAPTALPFLVLERLRGRDLRRTLSATGPLAPAAACRLFVEAASALAAAHAHGIVHRDVKPSNLFVHERGDGVLEARVCDFGIALVAREIDGATRTELTRTGHLLGSPAYMAPEQSEDASEVDARADVFALSVSLYEALVGAHPLAPFVTSPTRLLLRLHDAGVPRLATIAPWVPATLAAAVDRGVTVEPASRWRDMAALAAAIEPFACAPEALRASTLPLGDATAAADARARIAGDRPIAPGPRDATAVATRSREAEPRGTAAPASPSARARSRAIGVALALAALAAAAALVRVASRRDAAGPTPTSPEVAAGARPCASNADCAAVIADAPYCVPGAGTCVSLRSADCAPRADRRALAARDTLWIGAILPLASAEGAALANAADLARRDFDAVARGLPGAGAAPPRPVGLLACDDANAERAARHLVETVGVPAILGLEAASDVAARVLAPRGVLSVATRIAGGAPQAASRAGEPALGPIRVEVSGERVAEAVAAFVRAASPAPGAIGDRRGPRVCVVEARAADGALADLLAGALAAGAEAPTDPASAPCRVGGPGPDGGAAAEALLAKRPEVVVASALDDAFVRRVVEPVEARWPSGVARPRWIAPGPLALALERLAADRATRRRFVEVAPATDLPANVKLALAYEAAFGGPVDPAHAPSSAYDAFYLVAYGALAAGAGRVDGPAMARGLGRLGGPGKRWDVGPSSILDVAGALGRGEVVDLDGAHTPLDLDPSTGAPRVDLRFTCAPAPGQPVRASGLVFRAASRSLEGRLDCQ